MLRLTVAETVSQQGNASVFVNRKKKASGACVVQPDLHRDKRIPALSRSERNRETGTGTTTKFTQVDILISYFLREILISVFIHA